MMQSRKLIWLITLVVFVVLLEGSARRAAASPQNQDQGQSPGQQQQGSFPVGHATRVLNVPGIHNEIRLVNVHLWYPAPDPQNCQSGDGNSQGCPPSVYTSRLNGILLLPQWDPLRWTIGGTLAFEELPVSSAQNSYPVIIFSHGDRNNAIDYVYTLEALASRGFIVAAPDHLNNTQDDVRIDSVNTQANSTVIPCFDGLSTPCEILDRVEAAYQSKSDPVTSCVQNNLVTQTTVSVLESMTDRLYDISAIINALPAWFGSRADTLRLGLMGHSRGTVTALAAAGGSTCWGFSANSPNSVNSQVLLNLQSHVKAVMGLANGAHGITLGVDLPKVRVPTLLVAGSLDPNRFVSKQALSYLTANPNAVCESIFDTHLSDQCVLIPNAEHPHFDSGYCAETQSAGAIAQADRDSAILDLQTVKNLLALPSGTSAKEFCGIDTFTNPTDITDLVFSLIGFNVTSNPVNVPTTGLTSDEVKDEVVGLAVAFFGSVL